jgi:hypothetical protein
MKKLMLYMGYAAWFSCCLLIIYGIGLGFLELLNSQTTLEVIGKIALGSFSILLLTFLGWLCIGLIEMMFGDEDSYLYKKIVEPLNKMLP